MLRVGSLDAAAGADATERRSRPPERAAGDACQRSCRTALPVIEIDSLASRAAVLFPTVEFAIFFPIVLALSWALMPRQDCWKPFILVASYVFYAAADPRFCLLLGGDHGRQPARRGRDPPHRGRAAAQVDHAPPAVAFDLGVLGVFKYYGFFVQDVGRHARLPFGLGMPLPLLTIALPVGVSFFTFQAITYVVDVKRRQVEPASLLDAAIYLSFFPHLVAGPIVRASEFLPQLREPRDPNRVAVGAGLA